MASRYSFILWYDDDHKPRRRNADPLGKLRTHKDQTPAQHRHPRDMMHLEGIMKTQGNRSRHLRRDQPLRAGIHGPGAQGHPPPLDRRHSLRPASGRLDGGGQHLVKSLPAEKGQRPAQASSHAIFSKPRGRFMEAMVKEITGTRSSSMHHDISTVYRRRSRALHPGRNAAVRETKKK